MKKSSSFILLPFVLFIVLFSSCKEDDDEPVKASTNKWIYETMDIYYLWTDDMPSYAESSEDPNDYYASLLNSKDKWSYLTDDYTSLINNLNGVEVSAGYSLSVYLLGNDGDAVIGVVNFVYNNTPADLAGIERGDILMKVNGEDITVNNYYELLYETPVQDIALGAVFASDSEGVIELTGEVITVVSEEIDTNPIVHYEVLTEGSQKIGYLVYTDFISNYCSSDFDKENVADLYLEDVFTSFKSAGVDELILDLRYNRGGANVAAQYLASSLAPSSVTDNSVLVNYVWNDMLSRYWKTEGVTDQLAEYFLDKSEVVDMNLSRVVILTTGGTASASELTIIGLAPYMNVVTVGSDTHGKYVGSIVMPDDNDKWAIMPIVLKYSNAEGYTDFAEGIKPDHAVSEGAILYPFGDDRDPILAKGIEVITGETKSVSRSVSALNEINMTRIATLPSSAGKKDGVLYIESDLIK